MSITWIFIDIIDLFGEIIPMARITARQIVDRYAQEVLKERKKGVGRKKLSKIIEELSGLECTAPTVAYALTLLNPDRPIKSLNLKIDVDPVEDTEVPIEDLIKSRMEASIRKINKAKYHKRSLVMDSKPFGIMVFGDPHVDNEGCDWTKLHEDVRLVQSTEGVLAACVGDMQDNWIGRLAKLYSNSSVTASDGWRLSEWLLASMQWIAICGGNHDSWAHAAGVDPLKNLCKKHGVLCYANDEIRIELRFKDREDLDPIIWIIRHDFKGRSWYHPTHGPNKEAMLDGQCHLLTAGHIHSWGQLTTEQRHGRVTHAVRVRGYKRADSFAMEKGFFEQNYGESCLIVIDPEATTAGRISIFWDTKKGCQYLTSLRSKIKE